MSRDRRTPPLLVARETAADIADDVRDAVQPLVAEVAGTASFLILAALMVPVGLLVLIATFVIFAVITTLINPTGLIASALTWLWVVGTLAALFFAFRTLYRRLPSRLRSAYAEPIDGDSSSGRGRAGDETIASAPPADAAVPTLAELDAGLAPKPAPGEPT